MHPNQLGPLLGVAFWILFLVCYFAGPFWWLRRERKRQAIFDQFQSERELARQRRDYATTSRRLPLQRAVLGVAEDASPVDIDRAWRRKALELYPEGRGDVFPFWRVLDAYETMSGRQQVVGDYDRYLDAYLCTWLALSNRCRGVFIRLHGILLIWVSPLFFLGGPAVAYCILTGRGNPQFLIRAPWVILLAGLMILAPYAPWVNRLRLRWQDRYCRWRASRQAAGWGCPLGSGAAFPSERLHQLTRKSRDLDTLGLHMAQGRYGMWLIMLIKMVIGTGIIFAQEAIRGKTLPIGEGLLIGCVLGGLLLLVGTLLNRTSAKIWRISLQAASDSGRW